MRVTATGEQTSLADRKRRAGQRLFVGFAKPHVDDDIRYLARTVRPSGFVLFSRNVEEPEQVFELNRELASLAGGHLPVIIAVDQEGGRVQRVREPATRWPSLRHLGLADTRDSDDLVSQTATGLSRELRAMGFHLNFAPVADVDSNPDNPIIGDRSFGRDPHQVAEQVVRFIRATQNEGMIACAKHFPGHGDTDIDSHLSLPTVNRSEDSLRKNELIPFEAAILAGVGSVMSAHVVFPAFDAKRPATLSERVIPRLLRDGLGFDGVIFSDDMEMKAVAGRWSVAEQVHLSTRASVDVLLVCEDRNLQYDMFRSLVQAQEDDPGVHRASEQSEKRVQALRERFLLAPPPAPLLAEVGSASYRDLVARIAERVA